MEKFVEITRKDKGFDKENTWFEVCSKEGIPFITIKVRAKLATVEWDYITYPLNMDEMLFSMHKNIKAQASAIYNRYVSKDTWLGIGPGTISFGNLEIMDARKVASELFDVISQTAHVVAKITQKDILVSQA